MQQIKVICVIFICMCSYNILLNQNLSFYESRTFSSVNSFQCSTSCIHFLVLSIHTFDLINILRCVAPRTLFFFHKFSNYSLSPNIILGWLNSPFFHVSFTSFLYIPTKSSTSLIYIFRFSFFVHNFCVVNILQFVSFYLNSIVFLDHLQHVHFPFFPSLPRCFFRTRLLHFIHIVFSHFDSHFKIYCLSTKTTLSFSTIRLCIIVVVTDSQFTVFQNWKEYVVTIQRSF